jgi:hypothetical protein
MNFVLTGAQMAQWSNFYTLIGEAAATLTGLMFIAVTFGSKLVTPESVGLARAYLSPIFYHFIHGFFIACVALIPDISLTSFCKVVAAIAIIRLLMFPYTIKQLSKSKDKTQLETSDWILCIVIPSIVYVLFCVCSIAGIRETAWALYGVSALVLAVLILGVVTAWDNLIWMASRLE